MSRLSNEVYAQIETVRAEMDKLHQLLKPYHGTFYDRLNLINKNVDSFREYFNDCLRTGLVEDKQGIELPTAEKIAKYISSNVPESRQPDAFAMIVNIFPPKGTFLL
jgi:hypothetical protein